MSKQLTRRYWEHQFSLPQWLTTLYEHLVLHPVWAVLWLYMVAFWCTWWIPLRDFSTLEPYAYWFYGIGILSHISLTKEMIGAELVNGLVMAALYALALQLLSFL